jgi:hypothetical protein
VQPQRSWALFQDAPYSPLPVQNGDSLKGSRPGPVNDRVVAITGQRPETKRAGCQIGTGMAAQWSFGDKRAV